MTSVRLLWLLLCLSWVVAEIKLAKRNQPENTQLLDNEEHSSQKVLWLTIVICLVLALVFKSLSTAPIPIDYLPRQLIALTVVITGLGLRYTAVKQLGRFFTTYVTIQQQHALISDGLYRYVRHPAYTGLILAFLGAGIAMGDFIALMLLTIPLYTALNYRINIEEKLLLKKLGAGYQQYMVTTPKLFPWIL